MRIMWNVIPLPVTHESLSGHKLSVNTKRSSACNEISYMYVRPHSVYFTLNGSRQAHFCLVGRGKKIACWLNSEKMDQFWQISYFSVLGHQLAMEFFLFYFFSQRNAWKTPVGIRHPQNIHWKSVKCVQSDVQLDQKLTLDNLNVKYLGMLFRTHVI